MYVHVTLFWEGLGSSFKRESQAWISLTQCLFLPSLVEMSPCSGWKNKTKCRQCILALSVLSPLHVWKGRAGFFTMFFFWHAWIDHPHSMIFLKFAQWTRKIGQDLEQKVNDVKNLHAGRQRTSDGTDDQKSSLELPAKVCNIYLPGWIESNLVCLNHAWHCVTEFWNLKYYEFSVHNVLFIELLLI